MANGLIFVAANQSARYGEIDLIMRDGKAWVFVEVRYRKSLRFGDAAATVTPAKQNKILLAAQSWLIKHQIDIDHVDCRFDVFSVTAGKVCWIKNAFGSTC